MALLASEASADFIRTLSSASLRTTAELIKDFSVFLSDNTVNNSINACYQMMSDVPQAETETIMNTVEESVLKAQRTRRLLTL